MKNNVEKNIQYTFPNINPKNLESVVPGRVYYFEKTKSTNTEAKLKDNVPDKSLFIAEEQESGRGRLGREWKSPAKTGIWMSIYLKPQIPQDSISQLTLLAGLAVSRVIPDSLIKWPNDVILSGKKVCGILTEMIVKNSIPDRVICGIGINVNTDSFPEDLAEKATSIYLHTKKFADRNNIIKAVLSEFFSIYDAFIKNGFDTIRKEYTEKCITIGREVSIICGSEKKTAKAIDITEKGELLIETENGTEIVNSGEVSVRGVLGYC